MSAPPPAGRRTRGGTGLATAVAVPLDELQGRLGTTVRTDPPA